MHATHHPPTGASPPLHPTPADTLRQAAAYLRRHGWIQHRYFSDPSVATSPACAVGALYVASHGRPNTDPHRDLFDEDTTTDAHVEFLNAELALTLFLARHRADTPARGVYRWNDHPARTATDVIATLYAAADDFDTGGSR